MAEIQWSRLSSGTFEDMVACLLSHQNPAIRRIDGSGGDGGRDCQFEAPDGLHAYQMKGFPGGRMRPTQRRQVERSLKTAGLLKPVEWTLITPIDHTDGELKWFKKLGESVPFPMVWRGKTWLDLEFSQRRFIADYYLGDTRDEVIDLLRELNREEAALANGIPDAVARVESVVKRANALDPHYRFKIASDGATTSVTVMPAYAGAEVDRPIAVNGQFRFDMKTEAGRTKQEEFERALDFGTPAELTGDFVPEVTVDAPAGLGGTFSGPTVTMGPGKPVRTDPIDFVFSVIDTDGTTLAALPIHCVPQTSGRRGTILRGADRGGHVEAEVTIDVTGRKYRITFTAKWESFVPHDFAPVARFLAAYHAPNRVVVAQPDGSAAGEPLDCGTDFEMPNWLVDFVTSLAVIQAYTGIVREVGKIDMQDVANAVGGAEMLRGAALPLPWTSGAIRVPASTPLDTRRQMAASAIRVERVMDAPFELSVCGTVYPVGRRHAIRTVARVDPADVEALIAEEMDADLRVTLLPYPAEPRATVRLVE
jgi:hypothetical protein